MHHNQIINSSIIINIIVRGDHGRRDSFDDPLELLLPAIIQEAFNEDKEQQEDSEELQEPDFGRLRLDDHRIRFGQLPLDSAPTVPKNLPTVGTDNPLKSTENDDWF